MPFLTQLRVAEMPGGKEFRILDPLIYQGARDRFEIPVGFVFDFASIPGWATWLFPKLGLWNKPAAVHDWLYVEQPYVLPSGFGRILRRDADGIFRRILREEGVGWWRRHTMYRAVRLGGGKAWRRNRERLEAAA